jgi:hypothetical protein
MTGDFEGLSSFAVLTAVLARLEKAALDGQQLPPHIPLLSSCTSPSAIFLLLDTHFVLWRPSFLVIYTMASQEQKPLDLTILGLNSGTSMVSSDTLRRIGAAPS